jgi:hypothetical protein
MAVARPNNPAPKFQREPQASEIYNTTSEIPENLQ